jgi:hypothetical protein
MAITKTINIDVNTGKAVANTQALNNEINKTNKEVTQTKKIYQELLQLLMVQQVEQLVNFKV